MVRYSHVVVCIVLMLMSISTVAAQGRATLPAATTVPVVGERSVGTLVRYSDETNRYEPTQVADDSTVYGVVADRPAVVFMTGSTSVPVVTSGVALVKVIADGKVFAVGDVLTSAPDAGYAMRASTSARYAFGIVSITSEDPSNQLVSVAVDPERARQILADQRQVAANEETSAAGWTISIGRAVVAVVVVLAGLIGIVVGTRVTLGKAITAVGRNPRARGTVFSLAGVTIISAFALGLLTILVGVGILVLPL